MGVREQNHMTLKGKWGLAAADIDICAAVIILGKIPIQNPVALCPP